MAHKRKQQKHPLKRLWTRLHHKQRGASVLFDSKNTSPELPTIALFGAGNHGTHAVLPALASLQNQLRLSAIVEPHAPNAERAQNLAPHASIFADADALFAAQSPDIVYIATLPSSHTALSLRAFEACAHVICEKPLAPSVEECEMLVAAAKKSNRRLVVMFENRYKAHNRQIREWILSGRIGRVEAMHFQHFWAGPMGEPRRSDLLNALGTLDCGIHSLDLARFFVQGGAWEHISALGTWFDETHLENPPHLSILARLQNGPMVSFNDSMSYRIDCGKRTGARNGPSSLMIVGTHGTIEDVAGGTQLFDRDDHEELCAHISTNHAQEIPWVLEDLLGALKNKNQIAPSGFLPDGHDGYWAQFLTTEANRQANQHRSK
jgi:predicted dehydrogenase